MFKVLLKFCLVGGSCSKGAFLVGDAELGCNDSNELGVRHPVKVNPCKAILQTSSQDNPPVFLKFKSPNVEREKKNTPALPPLPLAHVRMYG